MTYFYREVIFEDNWKTLHPDNKFLAVKKIIDYKTSDEVHRRWSVGLGCAIPHTVRVGDLSHMDGEFKSDSTSRVKLKFELNTCLTIDLDLKTYRSDRINPKHNERVVNCLHLIRASFLSYSNNVKDDFTDMEKSLHSKSIRSTNYKKDAEKARKSLAKNKAEELMTEISFLVKEAVAFRVKKNRLSTKNVLEDPETVEIQGYGKRWKEFLKHVAKDRTFIVPATLINPQKEAVVGQMDDFGQWVFLKPRRRTIRQAMTGYLTSKQYHYSEKDIVSPSEITIDEDAYFNGEQN